MIGICGETFTRNVDRKTMHVYRRPEFELRRFSGTNVACIPSTSIVDKQSGAEGFYLTFNNFAGVNAVGSSMRAAADSPICQSEDSYDQGT
jgi:hypothetical protein